ncbi:hypothetical protein BJX76DRAFT_341971 [Aspergillus varians]
MICWSMSLIGTSVTYLAAKRTETSLLSPLAYTGLLSPCQYQFQVVQRYSIRCQFQSCCRRHKFLSLLMLFKDRHWQGVYGVTLMITFFQYSHRSSFCATEIIDSSAGSIMNATARR